jgi:hypothetical protein
LPLFGQISRQGEIVVFASCSPGSSHGVCVSIRPNGENQSLIEHWDGTAWSIVVPPIASPDNVLNAVTCVSASDCWAVGYSDNDATSPQTLIERWDGTAGQIVTSPNASSPGNVVPQDNILSGVTCASASDCWAVGRYLNESSDGETLIEHWDGTSWTNASSPNPNLGPASRNALYGVTCPSASECWTAGFFTNSNNSFRTLALRYTVEAVRLTSAVSRKTHGSAGTFDIDLPLTGSSGIECRSGGPNGDYTLVFTFADPLTSVASVSVTGGAGSVASSNIDSSDAHHYIVNLTSVSNAQILNVRLANVADLVGNFSAAVDAPMGVLVGDVSANGIVSNTDVASVKAQVAAPATASNFRSDMSANGVISNTDVSATKAQVGTALP